MIFNRHELLLAAPIKNMLSTKERNHGVSYGLAEAGYDIRVAEDIYFTGRGYKPDPHGSVNDQYFPGSFTLASTVEYFHMPNNLVGVVHDKSTHARRGLSVFNTVLEPGWEGTLTLELVYHGQDELEIPAGSGIAQILFSEVKVPNAYVGKYQFQEAGAQAARYE